MILNVFLIHAPLEVKAKTIDDTVGPHFFRPPPRPLMQPPVLASFNSTTQHQNGKWAHEYLDETQYVRIFVLMLVRPNRYLQLTRNIR